MPCYSVSFSGVTNTATIEKSEGGTVIASARLWGEEADGLVRSLGAAEPHDWQPILATYDGVMSPARWLRVVGGRK